LIDFNDSYNLNSYVPDENFAEHFLHCHTAEEILFTAVLEHLGHRYFFSDFLLALTKLSLVFFPYRDCVAIFIQTPASAKYEFNVLLTPFQKI
jgi:hypothetical protein